MSRARWSLRTASGQAVCLILVAISVASGGEDHDEAGRRLYREGRLDSGAPVRAVLENDVELWGAAAACARCHRRSGFGSNEGSTLVPPVTAPALFLPREPRRGDPIRGLYQDILPESARALARTPRTRPGYTRDSLAVALRTGIDPTGRVLDPLMPRYALGDRDMTLLATYLQTLSVSPDPGVDAGTIHFATIISAGIDSQRRRAMLDVLQAQVQSHNLEVRRERARPGFSPHYKDELAEARREWTLHVWELDGPRATWTAQLGERYRRRPVFAVVSGLVEGSWRPIHEFCDRAEVPCLFPMTELPVLSADASSYTLYFSRGLAGEAEALARWMSDRRRAVPAPRILQVYRANEEATALAASFRRAIGSEAFVRLDDHPLTKADRPSTDFWRRLIHESRPSALVLWLGGDDLASWPADLSDGPEAPSIYVSSGLLEATHSVLPASLKDRTWLTWPYALPAHESAHIYRTRSWLRSRKIAPGAERIQLNAYFTLSLAEDALVRMVAHFSREYLIEGIEHETENALNPGVFPHLSLGPGQRFASKGYYIVAPATARHRGTDNDAEWVVP